MEAKLYGQNKGGTSINGIIKDYYAYAGENISAGDLVEYVNGAAGKKDYGESADTSVNTVINSGYAISAVALDENRVFIAHSYNTGYSLRAVVCTIDGATITVGTGTILIDTNYMGSSISTCLLPNGNVFIAHSYGSDYYLYGIVCTIEGETITKGEDTALVSAKYAGRVISAITLDDNKVFIAHSLTTSYNLSGIAVTIDGITISAGTDKKISTNGYTGYAISTCLLPNGNIFMATSWASDYELYGWVISINGSAVISHGYKSINVNANAGYAISTCLLPNGNVFIAHSAGSNYQLYGIVVSISDTTITKGTDTAINTVANTGQYISTCLLPNGDVFIAHGYGTSDNYLYGIVVTIVNTEITAGTDTQLNTTINTGKTTSTLLLNNGAIFLAHSRSVGASTYLYLNAQIFGVDYDNNIPTTHIIATEYETQIRQVTTGQFDGIAKTSGEGGDNTGHKDMVSIWTKVPILTQEFAMSDGNTLADANGDIFLVREAIA